MASGVRQLVRNQLVTSISDIALARGDVEGLRRYATHVAVLTPQSRRVEQMAHAKVHRAEGRYQAAVLELEAALDGAPPSSNIEMYLLLALIAAHTGLGDHEANEMLRERFHAAADVVATPWSDLLACRINVRVAGDVEAGREGLRLVREHGNLRYEPDFRLYLGALGVEPADNLLHHVPPVPPSSVPSPTWPPPKAAMRRFGIRVPSRRRLGRFALTDAEQRVAGLVAPGLSNKAIGEQLAYSTKTIETYLFAHLRQDRLSQPRRAGPPRARRGLNRRGRRAEVWGSPMSLRAALVLRRRHEHRHGDAVDRRTPPATVEPRPARQRRGHIGRIVVIGLTLVSISGLLGQIGSFARRRRPRAGRLDLGRRGPRHQRPHVPRRRARTARRLRRPRHAAHGHRAAALQQVRQPGDAGRPRQHCTHHQLPVAPASTPPRR